MNSPVRVCSACNQTLPETSEFFRKRKYKSGTEYFYALCRVCERQKGQQYKEENHEILLEKQRSRYWKNPDKERARAREVMRRLREEKEGYREYETERRKKAYEARKEHYDNVYREYRAKHKERYRVHSLNFYYRNRDRILVKNRAIFPRKRFKSAMGQRRTTYIRNYRAAKMGAVGFHTEEDVYIQLARQDWKCYYCLKEFVNDVYDVDHLVPLTKGGCNWPANIVCACPSCNRSKNDKAPWEWQDFWLNHILKDA